MDCDCHPSFEKAQVLGKDQVNRFIADVLQDKMPETAEPWEHKVASEFRQAHAQREMLERRLLEMRQQITEGEATLLRVTGQAEALASLLIRQEVDRQQPMEVKSSEVIPLKKENS